jgi:hypothetical protein
MTIGGGHRRSPAGYARDVSMADLFAQTVQAVTPVLPLELV